MLFLIMLHITRRFLGQRRITIDYKKVLNRILTGLKYGVPFLLISCNNSTSVPVSINLIPNETYTKLAGVQKTITYDVNHCLIIF